MELSLRSRISLRSIRATKRRNRVTEDRKAGTTPALPWTGPVSRFSDRIFPARDPFELRACQSSRATTRRGMEELAVKDIKPPLQP